MRNDNPCDSSYILMNKLQHGPDADTKKCFYSNTKVFAKLNTAGIINIPAGDTF